MQNKPHSKKLYETKDLFIASVLYASGLALSSSKWNDGKCYFYFENVSDCEKIVNDYYQNKLTLNAKTLLDAMQTIKGILRSR